MARQPEHHRSPRWGDSLHADSPPQPAKPEGADPLLDDDLAPPAEAGDAAPEAIPDAGEGEFTSDRDRAGAARWEREQWRGRGDFEDTDFRAQGKPWDWDNTGDSPAARFGEERRFYAGLPGERERGGVDNTDDHRAPGRGDGAAKGLRDSCRRKG